MTSVVPDATFPLDQIRNARRSPQAGLVSEHFRAPLQFLRDAPQLGGVQSRLPPGPSSFLQRGPAFLLHSLGPPMHGLPVHAEHPRYFCLALSLLEHAGGTQAPRLQRTKIPLHTTWVAHAGHTISNPGLCHLYYARISSEAERIGHQSTIWAEATDGFGKSAKAILSTPDPYDFSANSALGIASRISSLPAALGLVTPSQAFGADFVLALPGCSRAEISPTATY